jgi:hypothetical protein
MGGLYEDRKLTIDKIVLPSLKLTEKTLSQLSIGIENKKSSLGVKK